MAYDAVREGGTLPCALNAANEIAVEAHLQGRIPCGAIPGLIRAVLDCHENEAAGTLEILRAADLRARERARDLLKDFEAPAR
jgi:1-deoxy-D-xylulose-5-phosphate reductoisomerase